MLGTVILVVLVLAAGCSSGGTADEASSSTSTSTSSSPPTSAVGPSLSVGGGAGGGSSTSEPDAESELTTEVVPPLEIELLAALPATLGERWPQLQTFGYYGRPSASFEFHPLPQFVLDAAFDRPAPDPPNGDLQIQLIDLNWGIDSSGLLVTIDGPREAIQAVEPELADSTRWLARGETWIGALYRGGLASGWEIEDLADRIEWIMRPEQACELSELACPYGPEVAFPPPPPMLALSGGVVTAEVPFEVLNLGGPTAAGAGVIVSTAGNSISWIEDGTLFSSWVGTVEGPPENRGPATAAHVVGSLAFVVEPDRSGGQAIVLRYCCDEGSVTVWPVPEGWTVEEIVMVGTFGSEEYRLLINADVGDGLSRIVTIPFNPKILNGPVWSSLAPVTFDVDADQAQPPFDSDAVSWTQLQRHRSGISVVEERADGWYLIAVDFDGQFGRSRQLLRSSHPVESYTLDAAAQHVLLTVVGPDGPVLFWSNNGEVTEIGHGHASVAWLGTHPTWTD